MMDLMLIMLIFTQIPVVLVLASRNICLQTAFACLSKNTEWIRTHPEFHLHHHGNRMFQGFCYILAALSLVAAVNFTLIQPRPSLYDELLTGPFFLWCLGLLIYIAYFHFVVAKKIPASSKRNASMDDRRLSIFIPLWCVYVGYGLLLTTISIDIWALLNGLTAAEVVTENIVGMSLYLVFVSMALLVSLRRKFTQEEQAAGPGIRKAVIRFLVAMLYFGAFTSASRILPLYFDFPLIDEAGPSLQDIVVVILPLGIQITLVVQSLNPKLKSLRKEYREQFFQSY